MLGYEDIRIIKDNLEKLSKIFNEIEARRPFLSNKIKQIDYNNVGRIKLQNIASEDAGYVTGTIGPVSYIYIKANSISKGGSRRSSSNIYFTDSNFVNSIKLSDIAEILAKLHEYFVIYDLLIEDKADAILMDGSIIADTILASTYFNQVLSSEERGEFLFEILESKDPLEYREVLSISYLSQKYIKVISIIFPILIRNLIEFCLKNNIFLFYFTKRPIGASFLSRQLSFEFNDMILLSSIFGNEEFYTDWYTIPLLREDHRKMFEDIFDSFYIMYYRGARDTPIYRVETVGKFDREKITKVLGYILFEESNYERYPKLLELAHVLSNVSIKDKMFIEDIIIKNVPAGWGTKEITRFL